MCFLFIHEPGCKQAQGQTPFHVSFLRQQHALHIGMPDDGHHFICRILVVRQSTLGAFAGVLERIAVACITRAYRGQSHADTGLVHHQEHVFQPAVGFANQVPGAAPVLTEIQRAIRRDALPHLVVQAGQGNIVGLSSTAVHIDPVTRDNEQGDAFHSGWAARDLGQHHVNNILAQFMFAAGDPHLVAGYAVGTVGLQFGPGAYVGQ